MSQADIKIMNDLSELLYSVVPVRAPGSREELEKHLTPSSQAFLATRIFPEERAEVAPLTEKAIDSWQRIESNFLASLGMDRNTFLHGFATLRSTGKTPPGFSVASAKCHAVVHNIEWINAFAWQLPVMDSSNLLRFHEIARMMAAIFSIEKSRVASVPERLEALLLLVFNEPNGERTEYPKYNEIENKPKLATSVINAILAIMKADCVAAHKKDLLDICIWKWTEIDGKWNTRYRSEGAMKAENWKMVRHEHVFQRKILIQQLLKGENPVESIMKNAIGCLVTEDEHKILTKISKEHMDIDGWERYRKAGIQVYDLKDKQVMQMPAVAL